MTKPKVSIIIPTYNRAGQLQNLLNHCLAQTYPPELIETIVIDDGGIDHTSEIFEEFKNKAGAHRCILLRQQNQGPGQARNCGIDKASGEVVVFLDDDMTPVHSAIEAHVNFLMEFPKSISQGVVLPAHDTSILDRMIWGKRFRDTDPHGQDRGYLACTANLAIYKTHLMHDALFNPEFRYSEDIELAFRLMKNLGLCVYLNRKSVAFHQKYLPLRECSEESWRYGMVFIRLTRMHPSMIHPEYLRKYNEFFKLIPRQMADFCPSPLPELQETLNLTSKLEAEFHKTHDFSVQKKLFEYYDKLLLYCTLEGGYQEIHHIPAEHCTLFSLFSNE